MMEKHKCEICFKRFINGRALGGHMRSHLSNLYEEEAHHNEIDADFQTSVSSDDEEDEPEEEEEEDEPEEEEKNNLLSYALRENPKKSIRLVDQEFSFVVEPGSGSSVILQDRESETESSKNLIRRRSKRIRRRPESPETTRNGYGAGLKKIKIVLPELEPEPVSSISYTSPDEDVAYCLMMMKRDKWVVREEEFGEDEDEFVQSDGDESDAPENNKKIEKKTRCGKYKCETCHKVFRSYQALGGHRASHKKIRINPIVETNATAAQETDDGKTGEEKIHECPVCYRVFASGQALGGHKRSHVIGTAATGVIHRRPPPAPVVKSTTKFTETLIDLNLPAPMEDEEISQVEVSALSDR